MNKLHPSIQKPLQSKEVNVKNDKDFKLQQKKWAKELTEEFQSYEKKDLLIILEYCDYNLKAAQNFLRSTSKAKVRNTLRSIYDGSMKRIEVSKGESSQPVQQKVPEVVNNNTNNNNVSKVKNLSTPEEEIKVPSDELSTVQVDVGPPLLDIITPGLLFAIFDYLDPVSLSKAGSTCKLALKTSQYPLLYKKFCHELYTFPPNLPKESAFAESLKAINAAGFGEFEHQFVQQANQNFRSFVWLPDLKTYYINRNYYKQFKDYRTVYLNAPRLSYLGVYIMKGKYHRDGDRDINGMYAFHMVEYYRYFRFLPDGSVLHCLSVKKLKQHFVEKLFSLKKDPEEVSEYVLSNNGVKDRLMRGEYIVQGDKLHIRLCAKKVLYEYKISFLNEGPAQFVLRLDEYGLRYVEQTTTQPLPLDKQGSKTFKFNRIPQYKDELEESLLKHITL